MSRDDEIEDQRDDEAADEIGPEDEDGDEVVDDDDDRDDDDRDDDDRDDGEEPTSTSGSTRRFRVLVGIAVALTLLAAFAIWFLFLRDDSSLSDDAVLSVDGRELSEDDFERRIQLLSALYGVEVPDPDSEDFDAFLRDSAKSLAVGLVLEDAAVERDVTVADRTVTDAFARYIEQQYPVGGRDKFIEELGNAGVSEAEVVAEFRRTVITRLLYNDVVEPVTISDEELTAEYEERAEELAISETRSISHLVVSTEEAAVAAKDRIVAGEEFAAVASEVSLDTSTKANGGDLGVMSSDMLEPAFGELAFSAPVGEVFGPVQNDLGWYVGVVTEIFPPRTPTLDEIREPLRTRVQVEMEIEQWRVFLEEQIAAADIDYADDYRPENPDAPPPVVLPDPLAATTSTTAPAPTSTEGGGG